MPILLPNLDDRSFEGILEEAVRRIRIYTPEWDTFHIESDPGLTMVQLFAAITESLLYRANRVPELNRMKFLQLLNVALQPASPAEGLVVVDNERGPVAPLLLEQGVVLQASSVPFVTRDPLNVLPVQAQVYYKRSISPTDPAYESYRVKYEAVLAAKLAEQADAEGLPFPGGSEFEALGITPQFYEPERVPLPRKGEPLPTFDLTTGVDKALWMALLAPAPEVVEEARLALANAGLSIGIAPAASGGPPPLRPLQAGSAPGQGLVFEIPDVDPTEQPPNARYARLPVISGMDVSRLPGVIMVQLPEAARLRTWTFDEPLEEGTADFPPRLEDEETRLRLITWLRIRQPEPLAGAVSADQTNRAPTLLAWVGVNAARVVQAVPVFNEFIGLGNGEPDQMFALANVPVLPHTLRLVVEEPNVSGEPIWQIWRQVDDLLSAGPDERVFSVDAESGLVRGGDGMRGIRFRGRILASYEYGGGPQGNLPIGAIDASPDPRLGGGYKLSNPLPTNGGALGETPLDGERRIPLVVRHRDRLVTLQDFRDVTRRTPGVNVGRVEVLPLFRPAGRAGGTPDANASGVVTVLVIPRFPTEAGSGTSDPLWPVPDRLFLSRVCSHLDERRLVTTEIYVNGPEYQRVFVSVGIQVRAGFFVDKVEKDAEAALALYLSALPPGGPEGAGWPLKKRLVKKDLEAVVTRVLGVEYVDSIEMGVESPESTEFKDLSGIQLPRLAGVSVRQGPAESLSSVFAPPGSAPSLTQDIPIPVTRTKC